MTPQPFFCVGAQKAGTSWLQMMLQSYEGVGLPHAKELHYFDRKHLSGEVGVPHIPRQSAAKLARATEALAKAGERLERAIEKGADLDIPRSNLKQAAMRARKAALISEEVRDLMGDKAYVSLMTRLAEGTRVYGEITPLYCALGERGFTDMQRLFPGAKFIFIMRDPVARLWSQIRMERLIVERETGEKVDLTDEIHLPRYTLRSDYAATVRALDAVADGDTLYLFFETLFGPEGEWTVRKIEDFLGLPPKTDAQVRALLSRTAHKGKGGRREPEDFIRAARAQLDPVYTFVRARFEDTPQAWMA